MKTRTIAPDALREAKALERPTRAGIDPDAAEAAAAGGEAPPDADAAPQGEPKAGSGAPLFATPDELARACGELIGAAGGAFARQAGLDEEEFTRLTTLEATLLRAIAPSAHPAVQGLETLSPRAAVAVLGVGMAAAIVLRAVRVKRAVAARDSERRRDETSPASGETSSTDRVAMALADAA